jgi:polyisoprenoid-binding protein YceI
VKRSRWLCVALCLGVSLPAEAESIQAIDASRSAVTFVARQMGVPAEGRFGRFSAQVAFDPARLSESRAQIDIALDSIDTGVAEVDSEVKRRAWFDTARFPTATFVSSTVRSLGGDRYEVAGKLTIKGRTRDIAAPFTVRHASGATLFEGAFALKRLEYGIGEGIWSDTDAVADEVQIRFRLTGTAGK